MNKFLDKHRMTTEEIENQNGPRPTKAVVIRGQFPDQQPQQHLEICSNENRRASSRATESESGGPSLSQLYS